MKNDMFLLRLALFMMCFYYVNSLHQFHAQMGRRRIMIESDSQAYHPSLSTTPPPDFKTEVKRIALSILLGLITGLLIALLVACIIKCFLHYINKTPILNGPVTFSPKIDTKTLNLALVNVDNQPLGKSSPNGATYYKATLDSALTIAVKRLQPFETSAPETHSKSFKRKIQRELEVLGALRHRNVMSLRACICECDRFSLVFDYMPGGSLEDAMIRVREDRLRLGWEVRMKIGVGIIKGLKFLHFDSGLGVLHYNLKLTNVMLDGEFEPRIADYGLANLMPMLDRSGANGFRAPESSSNSGRYTDKSDVFSFGVILGVLLTGKDPLDPFFSEAAAGRGSLGRWLRHLQQVGEARDALDKSIVLREQVDEDEMLMAVKIAVVCMSDLPADRPSSDELVPLLSQLLHL